MNDDNLWPYINFVLQPFIVGAAINYLPMWLATPTVMFCVVIWVGSIIALGDRHV